MIILFMLVVSVVIFAFNSYVFELNDSLNLEVIASIVNLVFGVVITSVYCYLSERITTALLEIGDNFYDMPWYQLPTKQQKLLALPIQRAQRELRLTGFGLFDCSLALLSAV